MPLGCAASRRSTGSLTNGAFLVGEQDAAIAAVRVGHVDGVAIGPVEFPEAGREQRVSREEIRVQKWVKLSTHSNNKTSY